MYLSSCSHNLLLAVLRYFTNSKAFRVFNGRTRIVEENLHVKFSEEIPNIAGNGSNWLFDIDALTKSMNYEPVVAWNQSNGIVGTKACENAVQRILLMLDFKTIREDERRVEHLENEDSEFQINSSTVNTAGIKDNDVGENIVYGCVDDPNMPNLEEIVYSNNDEDVDA
ncbi:hypothetical protein Tco_1044134 [Tanacetum coccineum]|uniref:Uncharacterized protein n=1 Tax=Tanacetum coccineum TaxID=301880 RepID=A0ABQ5GPL5_9ASTR